MVKALDILIVEDVARDAEAMEAELFRELSPVRARRVETREAFLDAIRQAPPDVVLSDFTLPEFNALEALKALQELRPDIPFILVTGNRSEEVAVECIREGADDYILKASLRRLPSSIRNALRKKEAESRQAEIPRLILRAQENERRRVARELHDSVNQLLSSAKFRFQSIEQRLGGLPDRSLPEEAAQARLLLDKAIAEVRCLSRNLRPSELDDLGLAAALRALCEDFRQQAGLAIVLTLPPLIGKLPGEVELNVYRIVQEALSNAARHSQASQVFVLLRCASSSLSLSVKDDGIGFEPEGLGRRRGMGLIHMQERAAALGGVCERISKPGAGTEIRVRIPLDRPMANPRQDL